MQLARLPSTWWMVSSFRLLQARLARICQGDGVAFFSPHSPAVPMAPYTREPEGAQHDAGGAWGVRLVGHFASAITVLLAANAVIEYRPAIRYQGIKPSLVVALPSLLSLGPLQHAAPSCRRGRECPGSWSKSHCAAARPHGGLGRIGISRVAVRHPARFAQACGEQVLALRCAACTDVGGFVVGGADFVDACRQDVGWEDYHRRRRKR